MNVKKCICWCLSITGCIHFVSNDHNQETAYVCKTWNFITVFVKPLSEDTELTVRQEALFTPLYRILNVNEIHFWTPDSHSVYVWVIHSVFCLTTGPKPPPKRFLHIVRSRASSFKWEYPLLPLRSSGSFLHLLPRLLVTSISPFISP